MTAKASPRPWRVSYDKDPNGGHNIIIGANGGYVVDFCDGDGWLSKADAELIVAAVNGLRSEDAPAGFDPYCARHGCQNCRIYARLQEAKKNEESK